MSGKIKDEDVRVLVDSVVKGLEAIQKPLEKQVGRLDKLIPKGEGIVDPLKWIKAHKPELLKDEKLISSIELYDALGGKRWRKNLLRRKTRTRYSTTFTREDFIAVKRILEEFIIDYDWSLFEVNKAKALLKEWEYHYDDAKVYFYAREGSTIVRGIVRCLEEVLHEKSDYDDEDKLLFVKFTLSFLNKIVSRFRYITRRFITEDGKLSHKFETLEDEVKLIDVFSKLVGLEKKVKKVK